MSYAGRIGQIDGVRLLFTRGENLEISPVLHIVYYAWNNRTFSNPGYGTRDIQIKAYLSPSIERSKDFDEVDLGTIPNAGNGDCGLGPGYKLPCGTVIETFKNKQGDHQYNTVLIKLNDAMRKRLSHTVTVVRYSATVNDDGTYNNIIGMFIERPCGWGSEVPEEAPETPKEV